MASNCFETAKELRTQNKPSGIETDKTGQSVDELVGKLTKNHLG